VSYESWAGHPQLKKIYVEITNRCNLHCSFCAASSRPKMVMDPAAFTEILHRIHGHTRHLSLHVLGEPLLHPQFADILARCHAHGMRVNLTTNGTLIGQHRQTLLTAPALRQLSISLHSLEALDRSAASMHLREIIALAKEASQSTTLYVSLRLWNLQAAAPFNTDAASNWLLEHLAAAFADAPFDPDRLSVGRGIPLAERVFLNPEVQFNWPHPTMSELGQHGHCRGLRDHLAILVDGTVVPCCLDGEGRLALGNIFTQSLVDILDSSRATRMREGFGHQWLVEPLCRRCSYRLRFAAPSSR
jgi:radical SAM protein with 4Fe4S-binding SPASM domain